MEILKRTLVESDGSVLLLIQLSKEEAVAMEATVQRQLDAFAEIVETD